jgi:hypothetical protein
VTGVVDYGQYKALILVNNYILTLTKYYMLKIYFLGAFGQELKWNLTNPKTFHAFLNENNKQDEDSIQSELVN